MQVSLTWSLPTTRKSGAALAITDILRVEVKRNGTVIGTPPAVAGTGAMVFSDTAPLTGSDVYTVDTVTTDNLVSDDSNAVTITVPNADPAAAVTDLAGTLVTP